MKRCRFGRTEIRISEVVIGGGIVGGILILGDEEDKRTLLRRAIDSGINWIDTAADYGGGRSEKTIGALLRDLDPAERPHVSTKVRLDPAGGRVEGQIERALAASLDRLGMQKVALYQLHNPLKKDGLTPDDVLGPGGVCDVFDRLKKDGRIEHAGFTALGDPDMIRTVVASGRMDSAQVYYNLLNPSAGRAVPATWTTTDFAGLLDLCAEHDVGMMNIRIFAGGALAAPERHGREVPVTANAAVDSEFARAARLFDELGDAYGSRAQTALRFGLSDDRVSCVVIGLAELAHFEEAMAAVKAGPLPQAALEKIAPLWAESFGEAA